MMPPVTARRPWRAGAVLFGLASLAAGGEASREGPGDRVPKAIISFADSAFPPTLHKFGFNATWSAEDAAQREAIDAAAAAGAPMASALLVTKQGPRQEAQGGSASALAGLLTREGATIQGHANPHLTRLRRQVAERGMMGFLQLAGAPTQVGLTFDPLASKPAHGNWYPLPAETAALSQGFASLVDAILGAEPAPTVWCFWQEPEHTLDRRLGIPESIGRYLDFFTTVGPALRARQRDALVAGIQMNGSGGESSLRARAEPSKFRTFAEALMAREAAQGRRFPLDFITIQNYRGEHSAICVANARKAFAAARFNEAPLLFNEWDFDIPRDERPIDREAHFEAQYNRPEGVMRLAGLLKELVDQPDLSYVLLMRDVFRSRPLAFAPVAFLNAMSELRRPLAFQGGHPGLDGLAAGDAASLQVILWNTDAARDQVLDLDLRALGAQVRGPGRSLRVRTLRAPADPAKGSWVEQTRVVAAEGPDLGLSRLIVPSQGFLLLEGGTAAPAQPPARMRFLRQRNWIDRGERNQGEAPHGMGHYEVRSGSLIASADGPGGFGRIGVVLGAAGGPDPARLAVDLEASDPAGLAGAAGLRVEYLDGDRTLGSLSFLDPAFRWPADAAMAPAAEAAGSETRIPLRSGTRLVLEIDGHAPKGWATADGGARRVLLTLGVAGTKGHFTVRARLGD